MSMLSSAYPSDLDRSLANEMICFRSSIRADGLNMPPLKLLKTMLTSGLQSTFPNVYIALSLYLTLLVRNCQGEQSFYTNVQV